MPNIATTDNDELVSDNKMEVVHEPPLTKSDDSDACIDEIECYPKQYDCRNNAAISESYVKFEQDMMSLYAQELQSKQLTSDKRLQFIQQKSQLAQEKHENKLSMTKLMIKQMNHHHRFQEQKYMHELQTLHEQFNRSEQKWKLRMNDMDEQVRQQQTNHAQTVAELRDEIQQYNAQNQVYVADSQKSISNFDNARLELNDILESHQKIVHSLEAKIDLQTKDMLTFRTDATTDKEEIELMVQSWMTQCEVLQQLVHEFRTDLTSNKEAVEGASVTQDEIKARVEKMGQTYENVLENVMVQIQEQTDVQKSNYSQLQGEQVELRQNLEHVNTNTSEKFTQIEKNVTLQDKKLCTVQGQFDELNEAATTLQQIVHITDGNIVELKDLVSKQNTTQTTAQTSMTGLQSIVAKLADASNNRFGRLEATLDDEVKSTDKAKNELLALFESHQERIKVVDNKIVIHSIQLGEMSKEVKDMVSSVTCIQKGCNESIASVQKECQDISKQMQTFKENSDEVNGTMIASVASLTASSNNVETRTSTIEKIIDTMSGRMDQFHDDHATTRGNFMEQHQSIETTVSAQLNQLMQQINNVQQTTQNDVRTSAVTMENKLKVHEGKLDQHDTTLSKLNAYTQSVILKHESIESNVASLLVDVKEIKQSVEVMDQSCTSQLDEHVAYAKSQFKHIADVAMPEQLESNKLLRARFVDLESRMKERHEKAHKKMSDRLDKVHDTVATMNETIDELGKTQECVMSDLTEMKQNIENTESDICAVSDAFTLEVAHRSELQTKLMDLESSVEFQSTASRKLESTMESHVAEIHEKQDQSLSELNHSLAQVLTLSQMKEAMIKQIEGCLVRLSLLDSSTAEHMTMFEEIKKGITDHEVQILAVTEDSKSKLYDTEKSLESYKVALDALSCDVQKQQEVQNGINDSVSKAVATCNVAILEIDERTTSTKSILDDVAKNIHDHIISYDSHVTEMKSNFDKHDEKQKHLATKLGEAEVSILGYHEKVTRDMAGAMDLKTQSFAGDLKATIDRHSDRLKTAKDARNVIRNDLKTLVDSMNIQFEQLRKQMEENKDSVANHLECLIQTRDALPIIENDTETTTKIEYLAGKFKTMNENSKSLKETISALQVDMEQWKNKSEHEMIRHVDELTSKIEFITGKFKSMNEKSKSTQESLVMIQSEIEQYKTDHIDAEKTTELVEEISTKIDYLAGKFKSLNDHSKSTNATLTSLQDHLDQLNKQQTTQMEQVNAKITEHEETMALTKMSMLSMISNDVANSEAAAKTVEQLHNDVYGKLFVEFNQLKTTFDEIKTRDLLQNTPKDTPDDAQGRQTSQVEELVKQIDSIVQQVQRLESEQHSIKANQQTIEASIPEPISPIVYQLKIDIDRLSHQVEKNVEELYKTKIVNEHLTNAVNGIHDRQSKYKKAIIKQHGQLKELVSVAPNLKRTTNSKMPSISFHDTIVEEVYHEARDAEEIVSPSLYNTEQRD